MIEHLRTLPDDWESWLVYADLLTQRGDPRGEMLVLESRGEPVIALADQWLSDNPFFGRETYEQFWWMRKLLALVDPRTPADLTAFAQPISQLLALIEEDGHDGRTAPRSWNIHRDRVFAATLAWIDRAFHAPVRGLGCWQELSEIRLLELEERVEDLDERTLLYYAPAVISFALRRMAARGSLMGLPWFVSGTLSFMLYPPKFDDVTLARQRQHFTSLDRDQRAALYANALVLDKEPPGQVAWGRVWDAEREGPRADWFELFSA